MNLASIPQGTDIMAQGLADGGIGFQHLAPGIYRLETYSISGGRYYLKQAAVSGEPQSRAHLDLRQPPSGPLELTFSPNMARIEGRVSDTAAGAITVLPVRQGKEGDGAGFDRRASTDQDGRFHVDAIEPGKYRLFAIEGFEDGAWGSAGLADSLGSIEVELRESKTRQVTAPLVRSAEWKAAVARFAK